MTDSEVPDAAETADAPEMADAGNAAPRRDLTKLIVFVVLPVLAVFLGALAGYLKYQDGSRRDGFAAADESVAMARETTVAILSYNADSVEQDLNAARGRLTGSFLGAYTELINEVVIPGAKEKKISAVATVPAAASVSATAGNAVVLVFVDQTTTIGKDAPTNTASSVKVTLDRVDGRWLVSGFEPV